MCFFPNYKKQCRQIPPFFLVEKPFQKPFPMPFMNIVIEIHSGSCEPALPHSECHVQSRPQLVNNKINKYIYCTYFGRF